MVGLTESCWGKSTGYSKVQITGPEAQISKAQRASFVHLSVPRVPPERRWATSIVPCPSLIHLLHEAVSDPWSILESPVNCIQKEAGPRCFTSTRGQVPDMAMEWTALACWIWPQFIYGKCWCGRFARGMPFSGNPSHWWQWQGGYTSQDQSLVINTSKFQNAFHLLELTIEQNHKILMRSTAKKRVQRYAQHSLVK